MLTAATKNFENVRIWGATQPLLSSTHGWASGDEILLVLSIEQLNLERLALQAIVSLVYVMPYLQYPVDADLSISLNGSANLQLTFC